MPSDTNRLTVPTLAKGLHVVVKPCNLRRSLLFKEIAILAVPRGPCLRSPLLTTVEASLVFPAAPGRRFGATVPGPRRVVIKPGPTGGRRCPRCGTLLKRWSRVRSSWSRSDVLIWDGSQKNFAIFEDKIFERFLDGNGGRITQQWYMNSDADIMHTGYVRQ
jgi:hypothetical protein